MESERKLKHAQDLKQRRVETLATSEERLRDQLYKNAQMQSCIDRHRDTLAINMRRLLKMKAISQERRDDIEEFSQEVQMLHEAMQSLVRACRRHQVYLDLYEKKLGIVRAMVEESRQQVEQTQKELIMINDQREALKGQVRQDDMEEQRLTDEVSDIETRLLQLEEDFTELVNEQNAENGKLETVETEIANETNRIQAVSDAQSAEIHALQEEIESLTNKKKELGDKVDQTKKELHSRWTEIVEIQTAEGHQPSLLPSQTDDPPSLDLKLIEESLEKEKSAVEEEKLAEAKLRDDIASLQDRLKKCNVTYEETAAEMEAKNAAITEELAKEKARKKSKLKMITELQNDQKTLADLRSAMKPLQQMADDDRLAREKEINELDAELAEAQSQMEEILAERVKIQKRAAANSENSVNELAVIQAELEEKRQRSLEQEEEIARLEKLCEHKLSLEEVAQRRKDADTASQEIKRYLESKYFSGKALLDD